MNLGVGGIVVKMIETLRREELTFLYYRARKYCEHENPGYSVMRAALTDVKF